MATAVYAILRDGGCVGLKYDWSGTGIEDDQKGSELDRSHSTAAIWPSDNKGQERTRDEKRRDRR